jgi:hypothetical protein
VSHRHLSIIYLTLPVGGVFLAARELEESDGCVLEPAEPPSALSEGDDDRPLLHLPSARVMQDLLNQPEQTTGGLYELASRPNSKPNLMQQPDSELIGGGQVVFTIAYGEIRKALLRNRKVAIKHLKFHSNPNSDQLKVIPQS